MTRAVAALAIPLLLLATGLSSMSAREALARRAPAAATPAAQNPSFPAGAPGTETPAADPAGAPRPGRIELFGDWALGCDNLPACAAVSLLPENDEQPYPVLVILQMGAGPAGEPLLRLSAFDQMRGKLDLRVDGASVARLTATRDSAELGGEAALRAIRSLAAGYTMELRQKTLVLGRISLNGLRDALAALDAAQGRTGTSRALAAAGAAPSGQARPAAAPPLVHHLLPPRGADGEAALTPRETLDARKLALCDGRLDTAYPVELHRLEPASVLVLLPCNAGAYNVSVVPLVAQGAPGTRVLSIARFDHVPGFTGAPGTPTLLVNPRWNPRLGRLSSFAKGRGLGDCGTAEEYVWDGAMFRLVEARAMPICRGAWEWPRIWYAETRGQ